MIIDRDTLANFLFAAACQYENDAAGIEQAINHPDSLADKPAMRSLIGQFQRQRAQCIELQTP